MTGSKVTRNDPMLCLVCSPLCHHFLCPMTSHAKQSLAYPAIKISECLFIYLAIHFSIYKHNSCLFYIYLIYLSTTLSVCLSFCCLYFIPVNLIYTLFTFILNKIIKSNINTNFQQDCEREKERLSDGQIDRSIDR